MARHRLMSGSPPVTEISHSSSRWQESPFAIRSLAARRHRSAQLRRCATRWQAGLRSGEIVALKWMDVDFEREQIRVRHSDWCGKSLPPKNGRIRVVGMTERLATALHRLRHLRGPRCAAQDDGTPLTRQGAWSRVRYAAKRAKVPTGVHILRHTFCSHLAMRGFPRAPFRSWPDTASWG